MLSFYIVYSGDTGIHVACLKINSIQGEASSTLSPHIANVTFLKVK